VKHLLHRLLQHLVQRVLGKNRHSHGWGKGGWTGYGRGSQASVISRLTEVDSIYPSISPARSATSGQRGNAKPWGELITIALNMVVSL